MGKEAEVLIPIFGVLDITGEVVCQWIIMAVLVGVSILVTKNLKDRPGFLQNAVEWGVEYLENFFADIIGKEKTRRYFRFLCTLFIFILVSNLSGLLPGVGLTKYVIAPTSSLSTTLGLGILVFFFLQRSSVKACGIKGYIKRFTSPIVLMLPLLALDEFVKPVSLAIRLYGNVSGEESILENLYHILPIGAPVIMMALSALFSYIQAMVFCMLVSIYLEEAVEVEED